MLDVSIVITTAVRLVAVCLCKSSGIDGAARPFMSLEDSAGLWVLAGDWLRTFDLRQLHIEGESHLLDDVTEKFQTIRRYQSMISNTLQSTETPHPAS